MSVSRRVKLPRWVGLATFALGALVVNGSASGQTNVVPARPRVYQAAPPRYVARPSPVRRAYPASPVLPYNRSPYTDDWSTSRHLPFPKPWMLPTRDPAYRGR